MTLSGIHTNTHSALEFLTSCVLSVKNNHHSNRKLFVSMTTHLLEEFHPNQKSESCILSYIFTLIIIIPRRSYIINTLHTRTLYKMNN
jgi:hypothetical protein